MFVENHFIDRMGVNCPKLNRALLNWGGAPTGNDVRMMVLISIKLIINVECSILIKILVINYKIDPSYFFVTLLLYKRSLESRVG